MSADRQLEASEAEPLGRREAFALVLFIAAVCLFAGIGFAGSILWLAGVLTFGGNCHA